MLFPDITFTSSVQMLLYLGQFKVKYLFVFILMNPALKTKKFVDSHSVRSKVHYRITKLTAFTNPSCILDVRNFAPL